MAEVFVKPDKDFEAMIRVRMSAGDAHYAGELVNGSKTVEYMGDVATNLCIMYAGNEGECKKYDEIRFTAPTYAGDFIEVVGRIIGVYKNKLKIQSRAFKIAENARIATQDSAVNVLEEPVMTLETFSIYEVPE
ncbi:acyl-CoA hydrolase [Clostridium tetanomorphum]|uniref:Acyl-CoA hydrolase n=2 Tax=Clostridium tetanomorphum TaxID=1553 RepID=A0A923ECK0_CLOTT|nr:acyl-CoA hydrolase [Clostridium tetanomorphum]MBC2398000.1 acyl-CoA hydrolase [Clostridium tetanomorphum]NRZ98929.1 3-aminobutyryl-CoA ammonia-lyase [Clostridium tetanomorphum]